MSKFRAVDRETGFFHRRRFVNGFPAKHPTRFVVEYRDWTCGRFIALVLRAGTIKAAPLPYFGQAGAEDVGGGGAQIVGRSCPTIRPHFE